MKDMRVRRSRSWSLRRGSLWVGAIATCVSLGACAPATAARGRRARVAARRMCVGEGCQGLTHVAPLRLYRSPLARMAADVSMATATACVPDEELDEEEENSNAAGTDGDADAAAKRAAKNKAKKARAKANKAAAAAAAEQSAPRQDGATKKKTISGFGAFLV
jgi:hypothetical protein